jgi:predicted Zn-dependent protease
MGDFERGLIQGEAMRHQIEKTNIDLLAENTKLRSALREVKNLVVGEARPRWDNSYETTVTRGKIADICDGVIGV